jgi:hexosaminidase
MKKLFKNFVAAGVCMALALSYGCKDVQPLSEPADLIPAPVEMTVTPGSISSEGLASLPVKEKISEKALLRHLEGQELTEWQIKSAYWMEITPKCVKIVAADEQGAYYARQSVKMMATINDTVACCTVLDWPRFQHRGFMLDESRHYQGKEFVYKQLEMMALLKLNCFHFHLVDNPGWRLQIDAYPRLTQFTAWRPVEYFWDWEVNETGGDFVDEGTPGAYGGYYTKQDIAEILAFAAERHIEVIPEIEMPGHNYETRAAYPELACSLKDGGTDKWELCPGKEGTYEFLENVLLEVFDLFPNPYIHIGGDEAGKDNWAVCPDCQARMKAEGFTEVEQLQSYMIKRIESFAHEHGKRIIGWDEILEGGLAPDATVMSWRGTEGGMKAIAQGHDVIFTPTQYCYFDYKQDEAQYKPVGKFVPLEKVYSFEPMLEGISKEDEHHVLGLQGNLWTEHVLEDWHAEMQIYPRLFAISEVGWTMAENKDWPSFERRASALSDVAREWGYVVYRPGLTNADGLVK